MDQYVINLDSFKLLISCLMSGLRVVLSTSSELLKYTAPCNLRSIGNDIISIFTKVIDVIFSKIEY